jgi:hypothetical protein
MAVTPSRSATARIDSPARPSVSATAMAAATMASTLSPGLGPGPVRAPGVRQSRAMERAGSPWPAKTGIPRTPYDVQNRTPVHPTQTGGPHAQARLHDGSAIDVEVHGQGPVLLLPVNPRPVQGPRAEELRRWGNDPALGRSLIDGPYAEMLRVTTATHRLATQPRDPAAPANAPAGPEERDWSSVEVTLSEAQTRQFVTLYQALQGFDDRAAQARLTCPRLCFAGSADEIDYGERWGGVQVHLARPLLERRTELESYGWEVRVLDGLDHTQAMQAAAALPILRPWLTAALATSPSRAAAPTASKAESTVSSSLGPVQ